MIYTDILSSHNCDSILYNIRSFIKLWRIHLQIRIKYEFNSTKKQVEIKHKKIVYKRNEK